MPEARDGIISPNSRHHHVKNDTGVVGSRWAPRSSKPVAGRVAGRGGFDSHSLPPFISQKPPYASLWQGEVTNYIASPPIF